MLIKAVGGSALITVQQWELDEQLIAAVQTVSHTHESARRGWVKFRLYQTRKRVDLEVLSSQIADQTPFIQVVI